MTAHACHIGRVRRTRTSRCQWRKVQKLWIHGVQEEQPSSGVMHSEEKKKKSEKETNPPFIFRTTHFSKRGVISVFIFWKMWPSNRRSIIGYKQTISTLQKPKKEKRNHVRLFCSYLKEKGESKQKVWPNSTQCVSTQSKLPKTQVTSYLFPFQAPASGKMHIEVWTSKH